MKKFWKTAGIATLVAILGVVGVGAVAYAQDDGSGKPFDFGGRFREAVAEVLGVSVEEYDAAVGQPPCLLRRSQRSARHEKLARKKRLHRDAQRRA